MLMRRLRRRGRRGKRRRRSDPRNRGGTTLQGSETKRDVLIPMRYDCPALFPRKWQRPYPNTCSERHSSCNNEEVEDFVETKHFRKGIWSLLCIDHRANRIKDAAESEQSNCSPVEYGQESRQCQKRNPAHTDVETCSYPAR